MLGVVSSLNFLKKLAHLLSPFFSGFPSLLLFPASCRCCANVLSMRCLISVHISPVIGNNNSQLTSSVNKMYYYPSRTNGREVCLAHAYNNDMPGAAILILFLAIYQGSHNFYWHWAREHESVFLGYNRNWPCGHQSGIIDWILSKQRNVEHEVNILSPIVPAHLCTS